jgi:hypothetical protein
MTTGDRRTDEEREASAGDRWYVPLLVAAAVVVALLVAGVAALEVFATRNGSETTHVGRAG